MHPLIVENRLPVDNPAGGLILGLVRAEGVAAEAVPDGLANGLAAALDAVEAAAAQPLPPEREARRQAARDMLRNGRYKPTGRGKPASEYLLRAAAEGAFPRINALVDVSNLVSAEAVLPISLWDLDRAGTHHVRFRLGREGEQYIFNPAGQALDLQDLVAGCRVPGDPDGPDEPFVTPIKDAQATKTTPETWRVAACVYAPHNTVSVPELEAICETFASWLARCGEGVAVAWTVAPPGSSVRL